MGYSSRFLDNPKYNSNPADYGVGDFNGDGIDDVIFAGPSWSNGSWDGLSWSPVLLKSTGVGQYEIEIANHLTSTIHTRVIESGDLNSDGQDDFFFFDHGHDISPFSGAPNAAFFSSGSTLQNAAIPTFNDYSHGGDIGDVDGDGDLDILSLSMSGYSSTILLNNGTGQFSATTLGVSGPIKDPSWHSDPWEIPYTLTSETETFFNTAKLDDFTGDGLVDLLVGGQHYGHSFVAENLGDGTFDLENAKELPTSAFFTGVLGTNEQLMEAIAIDLNGDGLNDIIGSYTTPSYSGRALQIFVNNGDATFRDESTARFPNGDNVDPNGQWVPDLELTDFNNDGHFDVSLIHGSLEQANNAAFVGAPVTDIPIMMLNDGTGRFSLLTGADLGIGNLAVIPVTGGYIHHNSGILSESGATENWQGVSEVYFMSGNYGTAGNGQDGADLGAPGFNEDFYLNSNPAIRSLVNAGQLESGLTHYLASGRGEGRLGMAPGTKITGSTTSDLIVASSGDETVIGGAGADTVSGSDGSDLVYGNKGEDRLVGGSGSDTLFGGQQSDTVFGLSGPDQVYGNKQDDTLHGGLGDDSLFGGQQDDLLYGQFGNDRIDGNRGNDTLYGEDGIDTFVISKGDDWVMDFNIAQDKIETADAYLAITQSVSSGNLVLSDSDGDTLTLLGVTSRLSEGYFV